MDECFPFVRPRPKWFSPKHANSLLGALNWKANWWVGMFGTKHDQQKMDVFFFFFGTLQRLSGHVGFKWNCTKLMLFVFIPKLTEDLPDKFVVQFVGGTVQTNWLFLLMFCGETSIEWVMFFIQQHTWQRPNEINQTLLISRTTIIVKSIFVDYLYWPQIQQVTGNTTGINTFISPALYWPPLLR